MELTLLILAVVAALAFDVVNGFHDAANSIATVVSTRVLKPHYAVLWAAFFNFFAMFIFAPKVADTIAHIIKIEVGDPNFLLVILSGLLGAITWDLITWWLGLPTSSSHALIGGLSGAGFAYAGFDILRWDLILLTIQFIFIAPISGFILGAFAMILNFWIFRKQTPHNVDHFFRTGQLFSAALYSIGHGANDAQKTMGVILALMMASGHVQKGVELSLFHWQTSWIILSCYLAISLGTAIGGWRIVKTMGTKITKLKPMGGFSAEISGAATLFYATFYGIPVSTTQTIAGSIMGVGAVTITASNLKWGIAARILWTWILTLPVTAVIAAFFFLIFSR